MTRQNAANHLTFLRRETRVRLRVLHERRFFIPDQRPIPHPATQSQAAGLTEGTAIVPDLEFHPAVAVEPQQGRELVDRRRALGLEAAAGHLAARPPVVTAAPVGVARIRADHLDSDHHTAPPAPVADRQAPRWCLASVDHDQPLSGRIYRLVEADPVTRNAVSGRRTTSWH